MFNKSNHFASKKIFGWRLPLKTTCLLFVKLPYGLGVELFDFKAALFHVRALSFGNNPLRHTA